MKLFNKVALSWILVLTLVLAFVPATFAKSFPSESIENLTKSWKIKFNQPVAPSSVTANEIYILDGNKKIATSLKLIDGGKTIEVMPLVAYEPGKTYKLEVAGTIKSTTGKTLAEKVSKSFNVLDKSAAIQAIQHESGDIVHNFIIKAREDVHSVKINGVDLHLTGWNEFSYGFTNLKPGSTVTIRAYSSTNKILETKTYVVD